VRRLAAALLEALYLPVEKRLWRRVDELAATYGQDPPITIPLTQEDLAQLAGTTRQTANRILREGEREGALDMTRGRVAVLDIEWVRRHSR
jgi:CRP-like cAMP-binding protein